MLLGPVSAAVADVRSGSASDPVGDASFGSDISNFAVADDEAGTITVTVQFSAAITPPVEISTGIAATLAVDEFDETISCGGADSPLLPITVSVFAVGPPAGGSATLSLPGGDVVGAIHVDGSGSTVTASFTDVRVAGLGAVCAAQARMDGDVAPDGPPFAFLPFEGFAPLCADGADNDGDGVVHLDDPGCRGSSLPPTRSTRLRSPDRFVSRACAARISRVPDDRSRGSHHRTGRAFPS